MEFAWFIKSVSAQSLYAHFCFDSELPSVIIRSTFGMLRDCQVIVECSRFFAHIAVASVFFTLDSLDSNVASSLELC